MNFITSTWQHLPETIDPIAFTIGFFSVHWYSVWFLAGFFIALWLAFRLARRGDAPCPPDDIFDLFAMLFFGALLGGRIGYVLLYHPDVFLAAPLPVFSPYYFFIEHDTRESKLAVVYYFSMISLFEPYENHSRRKEHRERKQLPHGKSAG